MNVSLELDNATLSTMIYSSFFTPQAHESGLALKKVKFCFIYYAVVSVFCLKTTKLDCCKYLEPEEQMGEV